MFLNNLSLEKILEQLLYGLPAIIIAFTLHEFMHAYVSDRLGDPTPRSDGRLTLNPIVHIDGIGLIMIILLGFGWAKPVRTSPSYYANKKKGRILVSIAGPLSNLAIAFVSFSILYFGSGYIYDHPILLKYVNSFIYINLMLFAFNMLPVPPLDGFTLLEVGIHPSKYRTLAKIRQYGLFIIIGLSIFGILSMYIGVVSRLLLSAFSWFFGGISNIIGLF